MEINLINYKGDKWQVELGPIEEIVSAVIQVLSGDEVLTVVKKDGSYEVYDSTYDRTVDFFDDVYQIVKNGEFLMTEAWLNRNGSYRYQWDDDDGDV